MNDRATNTLLAILVLFFSVQFLQQAQDVIVPLLVAVLLSYLTYPLVEWLTDRKVPTALAIGFVLLLTVSFVGGLAILIRETIVGFLENYPKYEVNVLDLWRQVIAQLHIKDKDLEGAASKAIELGKTLAANTMGKALNGLLQFLLVMVYLVFLLLGHHLVPQKLKKAFTPQRGEEIEKIIDEMQVQVLRYIGLKTGLALAIGAVTWMVLAIFEVDFAVLWGIVAFLFYYIPTVGSIVASIPPILLAFIQHGPWTALYVAVGLIVFQSLIGNLVEPRVMGQGLDLDPVVQIVALVFFGWMWGIVGAVLSVPLMVVVKIACAHVQGLKPVAIMLGTGALPTRAPKFPDS